MPKLAHAISLVHLSFLSLLSDYILFNSFPYNLFFRGGRPLAIMNTPAVTIIAA